MVLTFVILALFGDAIYRMIHVRGSASSISREGFSVAIYGWIGIHRALIIVCNLVPWIALMIIKAPPIQSLTQNEFWSRQKQRERNLHWSQTGMCREIYLTHFCTGHHTTGACERPLRSHPNCSNPKPRSPASTGPKRFRIWHHCIVICDKKCHKIP